MALLQVMLQQTSTHWLGQGRPLFKEQFWDKIIELT